MTTSTPVRASLLTGPPRNLQTTGCHGHGLRSVNSGSRHPCRLLSGQHPAATVLLGRRSGRVPATRSGPTLLKRTFT